MAILGASADALDSYDAAIAREYSLLALDGYRTGRRAFLMRLANAPRTFQSDCFHARLDQAARVNIARAISRVHTPATLTHDARIRRCITPLPRPRHTTLHAAPSHSAIGLSKRRDNVFRSKRR
jgi:hypothetical protein